MTTIRLNDDLNNKLLTLKNIEQGTKTEIIKRAIAEYYEHHVIEKTPYELGENLFGKYGILWSGIEEVQKQNRIFVGFGVSTFIF